MYYARFIHGIIVLLLLIMVGSCRLRDTASTKVQYEPISEFSADINTRFETFLKKTQSIKERKIAVFDCDGTLLGQVPHYLADEALFRYAKEHYASSDDSIASVKMEIVDGMLSGHNTGTQYVQDRIHFFAGMPADSVEDWGAEVYQRYYRHKFYPAMEQVVKNLQSFDFEVWIITASPELLYQEFVSEKLGIPENRIIGVKSVTRDGTVSDHIVHPVPQDDGKAETIATFIETEPLFVAGNSMGDVPMIEESAGLKWIVNPNAVESEPFLNGSTLKDYAARQDWMVIYAPDQPDSSVQFVSDEWNVRLNQQVQN